jgi:catechol 2,3-dioxygenase-like lactoylglutathione lyase family enzyme
MSEPVARVSDVVFLRFELRDIEAQKRFLTHFGFACAQESADAIRFRGTSSAPHLYVAHKGEADRLLAIAYRVERAEELEALAARHGVQVEAARAPETGRFVRLRDPDGLGVEVWHGMKPAPAIDLPDPVINTGHDKPRRNVLQRFGKGASEWRARPSGGFEYGLPAAVMRLGHTAINVADAARSIAWYRENLGLLVTDNIVLPDGFVVGAFMRCDCGPTPVDHHTLNIVALPPEAAPFHGTFGHAGFEIARSFDDLLAGHCHMQTVGGYVHEWGVGRHLLGSQLYDYWRDPSGFIFEHWTDGDLLTADVPAQDVPVVDVVKGQYGPLVPSSFNLQLPPEAVPGFRASMPGPMERFVGPGS